MVKITHAMVFAAGRGERMRPLTDQTPKPLLPMQGQTPLAFCVAALAAAAVHTININYHHLGTQIISAVQILAAQYPEITFHLQDETIQLLDTGGGIKRALPLLSTNPFFTINAADFWTDGDTPALVRLQQAWAPAEMDALLLLHDLGKVRGDNQKGDFVFEDKHNIGAIQFKQPDDTTTFMFGGATIIKTDLFKTEPSDVIFSQNTIWRQLAAQQRLHGLLHDGLFYHLTSAADYAALTG